MNGIFDAIGIMVKQDGRSIARAGGFDAVAIEVKSQRIMARKYGSTRTRSTTSATHAQRRAND